jgi:HTH-type transcriptional regulator, sugar sensing transcriptional regulator
MRIERIVYQDKLLKALMGLGLSQLGAETYLFLLKLGPIRASEATKALRISKQRLYPIIRSLQSKGIVSATLEHPARFSAIPFEKVLDLFVTAKMEEAQRIQQNKTDLLSDWQSIGINENDRLPTKFTVIEGRSYVYSKIQQIIEKPKVICRLSQQFQVWLVPTFLGYLILLIIILTDLRSRSGF